MLKLLLVCVLLATAGFAMAGEAEAGRIAACSTAGNCIADFSSTVLPTYICWSADGTC